MVNVSLRVIHRTDLRSHWRELAIGWIFNGKRHARKLFAFPVSRRKQIADLSEENAALRQTIITIIERDARGSP